MQMTLDQGQGMILAFNSISYLHLQTLRSQVAIVSEKSTVLTLSYRKAQVTKFDIAVK